MRHPPPHPHRYRTAVRYIAAEYLRNRTALFLLVVFVPLWYVLIAAIEPHDPVSHEDAVRKLEAFLGHT